MNEPTNIEEIETNLGTASPISDNIDSVMDVTIQSRLLKWARERASLSQDDFASLIGTKKNPAPVKEWEQADGQVTLTNRKLEEVAKKTRTPFGLFFLQSPPVDQLPIADFRGQHGRPSASLNLLDVVNETQLRQSWLSDALREDGEEPLGFVNSKTVGSSVADVASSIRDTLRIGTAERRAQPKSTDMVLWMIERLEESRITVIRKGFAGTATNRSLDQKEFKGFALTDSFAPFIFVNGKDWPRSQVFTIAHELAHIWLGISAIPDGNWFDDQENDIERFCNNVAAEVLIPSNELAEVWRPNQSVIQNAREIAHSFRVSSLASIYKAHQSGLINQAQLEDAVRQSQAEFTALDPSPAKSKGGNYYNNQGIHLGKRFIREVLSRTLEGRILYSEAFELLGTRKTSVFKEMAEKFL